MNGRPNARLTLLFGSPPKGVPGQHGSHEGETFENGQVLRDEDMSMTFKV